MQDSEHVGIYLCTRPNSDKKLKNYKAALYKEINARCMSDPNIKPFVSCLCEMNLMGIYCFPGVEDQFCAFLVMFFMSCTFLYPLKPLNSAEYSNYKLNNEYIDGVYY